MHAPGSIIEVSAVEVIARLTTAIDRSDSEQAICDGALDALEQGLHVRRASILLFDADRVMRFKAWRRLSTQYRHAVEGHTPWQPETRNAQIIVLEDVRIDPGLAPFLPVIQSEGIAAMVFVPLTTSAGVIGKFMLYFEQPHAPAAPELALARIIAAEVAFAVQRTRAEKAARDRETELRLVTDVAPVYIARCDLDQRYRFVNRPFAARFGLEPSDIIGKTIEEVLGPEAFETVRAHTDTVLAGQPVKFEVAVAYPRLGDRVMHGEYAPEFDATGKVTGFVAVVLDVTERRMAEAALQASERAARFLANASRTLSALVDYPAALQTVAALAVPDFADWCAVDIVEPDGSMRRLALSHWVGSRAHQAKELERRYPSRPEDPYGPRAVLRSGRPELIDEITDSMLVAAAHDESHLALLRRAGLKSCVTVPLKAGAQIVGALTFLTSHSGRRYGPADLTLAEELAYRAGIAIENARLYGDLQRADRQKDEFLAVLAHELRNPLAPIRTALQLIRLAPEDVARRERACNVMDRQLQQMVRLVDDLLDVSRITRGKIELQQETIALDAVVQNAVETSRPQIEGSGHTLTVTVPDERVYLSGDPTRLAQVFSNLLNNAAKYTSRGGRIDIAAERQGDTAVIRVKDTGVGIPPDMLTSIFDMFTQVDGSLEKTHGGLGIGLTLAKRLVEMHGGTVSAFSDGPGAGSQFVVSLPILSGSPRAADPACPADASIDALHRRILVVDDNRDAAESLAEMLRLKGHDVHVADDGMAAVQEADEFLPDVVLLDLGMPRLNGYDAARQLRNRLGPAVLLIAVTGWGQEEHRRRSQQVGFDHHMVKPVDPAALDVLLATGSRAV